MLLWRFYLGSLACGEATEDSDMDVKVVVECASCRRDLALFP